MTRAAQIVAKTTREISIESYFVSEVHRAGGVTRKLKWIGRRSAPDRFISFPHTGPILVELKRPGETPRPDQKREHDELRRYGVRVWVISTRPEVDAFVKMIEAME